MLVSLAILAHASSAMLKLLSICFRMLVNVLQNSKSQNCGLQILLLLGATDMANGCQ